MTTKKEIKEEFRKVVKDLEDNAPDKLEDIKRVHSDYEYLLYSEGVPMDSMDADDIGAYDTIIDTTKNGLKKKYDDVEPLFFKLKKKLKNWNGIKFGSQIITTFTGATLFIMLFGTPQTQEKDKENDSNKDNKKTEKSEKKEDKKKFIGPTLILVSSLLALLATYKTTTVIGGEQLDQKMLEVIKFLKETDGLINDLERYDHPNATYDLEVVKQQLIKSRELRGRHLEIKLLLSGGKS